MARRSARPARRRKRGRPARIACALGLIALIPLAYSFASTMLAAARSAPAPAPRAGTSSASLAAVATRSALTPAPRAPAALGSQPLPPPAPLAPFTRPALRGEGRWHPAGRPVRGRAAIYETELRAPSTPLPAGIAWMDTSMLRARLYAGSNESPGGGPWRYTAPIQPAAAASVVAAFNGGFKMPVAGGGYYSQRIWAVAPERGAATLAIRADGSVALGAWGYGVRMAPDIVAVRQNLRLLVSFGRPAADAAVVGDWGATLGGGARTWRSGLGITRSGALVYVAGPDLDPLSLADLLIRAGALRAMELDINPEWTILATYRPRSARAPAAPSNGTSLIQGMVQSASTFFESWWARDFITMSAR